MHGTASTPRHPSTTRLHQGHGNARQGKGCTELTFCAGRVVAVPTAAAAYASQPISAVAVSAAAELRTSCRLSLAEALAAQSGRETHAYLRAYVPACACACACVSMCVCARARACDSVDLYYVIFPCLSVRLPKSTSKPSSASAPVSLTSCMAGARGRSTTPHRHAPARAACRTAAVSTDGTEAHLHRRGRSCGRTSLGRPRGPFVLCHRSSHPSSEPPRRPAIQPSTRTLPCPP